MGTKKIIDLRSDTVTRPTAAMLRAMMKAEVGDDVFGEDPTVNLLQERVAELLGKERALFAVSGTMTNEIAVNVHTDPGDGVIVERLSHIFLFEAAGAAALSGVQLYPLEGSHGIMGEEQIKAAINNPDDPHQPRTRLICIENTHNRAGGTIYQIEEILHIQKIALTSGLRMHLDGARLFNAQAATGISVKEYARCFDSVSVCLSKGLGAPIGSVLAGSEKFIEEAIRIRKRFGGGWRQAGYLAAAGLYALDHHVERLTDDHRNARVMAEALSVVPGLRIDPEQAPTNILIVEVEELPVDAHGLAAEMANQGVLFIAFSPRHFRLVTHLDVTLKDCRLAARLIAATVKKLRNGV